MKKYIKPIIEEEKIELEDIIATSVDLLSLDADPYEKDPFKMPGEK